MADISKEIKDFQDAVYGEEVRGSMISLAEKLNQETTHAESTATKMDGELERVAEAESAREQAETKRASAEQERKEKESERVQAESGRVTAEEGRASAESEREKAEQARASAEEERARVESERVTAESERAEAETARDDAEKERVQTEEARVEAEGKRAQAETERSNAEENRAQVEAARVQVEEERVSAESQRAENESARELAETGRSEAETARAKAETTREQKTDAALTGIVTASQTLQEQIEKADENIEILQNLNLEGDIAAATQAAKDLQNIVTEAEPKVQEIEGIIDTAGSLKTDLDADIETGTTLKQQLDGSVEGAQGAVQAATEAAQAANKAASDIQQKAEAGDFTAKITGVEVEMVGSEEPASVENIGTEQEASFHFKIPKGLKGEGFTGGEIREGHLYLTKDDGTEVDAGPFDITKDSITTALTYTPDAQPQKLDYTLDPAQWTGEAFPYLYTIPLPDTTANQRIYATAAPGLTEDQINAFAEAVITGNSQTDGQIVLQAVNKPSAELPIVIEIGGVVTDAS